MKSSSDYTAAIRRLTPTRVTFSGARKLAAAVTVPLAIAASVPSTGMEAEQKAGMMERNSLSASSSAKGESRIVRIDRMCDRIVINIQNTDGKGQETIRREIIKVLGEIYEV